VAAATAAKQFQGSRSTAAATVGLGAASAAVCGVQLCSAFLQGFERVVLGARGKGAFPVFYISNDVLQQVWQ
jgi:hypothetical protein